MSLIAVILIVLLLFGGIGSAPVWSYSRDWGYAPSGLVVVLLILLLLFR